MKIGLEWDSHERKGHDFDLYASAFMVGERKQIRSEPFFIFYGNTDSPDGALRHTGDDPTCGKGDDVNY